MKWLAPRLARFWQRHPGFDLRFYHTNLLADFADAQLHVAIEWRHLSEVSAEARLLVPGNLTPACGPALMAGSERPARAGGPAAPRPAARERRTQLVRLAGGGRRAGP